MNEARPAAPTARRAVRLEQATIAYNVVESLVAVASGLVAGLVSLVGFGIDSGIEVAAAAVVLHRLSAELRGGEVDEAAERRALRLIALTFFALAIYVTVEGAVHLVKSETPDTSPVGVAILAASVLIRPWLARAKRRTGEALGSRLVIADAAESRLCAWFSASTFAGLTAFTVLGWTWLDALAGFVIAGFALMEGREAWEGELACDNDREEDEW